MGFLKKHWEKLLLVLLLVGVIGAAGWLMLKVEDQSQLSHQLLPRKSDPIPHLDPAPYNNAIATLENPLQWEAGQRDPFVSPEYDPQTNVVTTVQTNAPACDISLLAVQRVPFKMNFKAYTGNGENLQIDFKFRPRTFFINKVGDPIKDRYEDTGFKTIKFEKKTPKVFNPNLGGEMTVDASELTIQRGDDKPIVLILNREAEEEEPVATVRCESERGGSADFRVRRGQMFNCCGKTYKVVDITPNGMIIIDIQTEEKQTLPVSRESEESPRGERPW